MIFYLGSSVTYGSAADGKSFVEYLAERTNSAYIKEAVSGTMMTDSPESYIERMKTGFDRNVSCDYFICQLSTNDATQKRPLGDLTLSQEKNEFDTSTVIGAVEYIISYVRRTWNCPVIFFTNVFWDNQEYAAMVEALYRIQKKWQMGIIDLWNNPEMKNVSEKLYKKYMADVIHPTAEGYLEWWTPVFEEYLQNVNRNGKIIAGDL